MRSVEQDPANSGAVAVAVARAEASLRAGDVAGAAAIAVAAVGEGAEHPMLLNLAAWAEEERGALDAAAALLDRALRLAPGDALILAAQGALFVKRGWPDEALALLDRVLARMPGHAPAWHDRGRALELRGDGPGAAASYARAVAADPRFAAAYAHLAGVEARDGRWAAARAAAMRALAIDPQQHAAEWALAAAEAGEGDPGAALARLDRLLDIRELADDLRAAALSARGDALERLGDYAPAFHAFAAAQAIDRRAHAARFGPGGMVEDHVRFAADIHARFAAVEPALWRAPASAPPFPSPAREHVFLLGYPRSGTTLVETILLAREDVVAVEERPTLLDADRDFLREPDGMERLARLNERELCERRAAYWRRVAAEGVDPAGKVFIDMAPLNGVKLPLIARLFPDARIVVVSRDPRDAVLSCFRHRFRMNASTYCFTDLEATARHYDATMRLMADYFSRLPFRRHVLRYRDLVADFEPTVRALLGFLKMEWSERHLRFDEPAQARSVRTASATQVRRALFNGVGQWRRYRRELEPVLPILELWVERFDFPPTALEHDPLLPDGPSLAA